MAKDQRRENTKKALLKAMVICLEKDNFNDITTSQLAQTAGISRSSFYTHYKDKYEMIDSYQKELFHKLEYVFDKHDNQKANALLEIFEFLSREQLLSALLSHHGTYELQKFLINKLRLLISNDLSERFGNEAHSAIDKEYISVYFSHAVFGICQTWIARGKKETPQEMTDFLMAYLP